VISPGECWVWWATPNTVSPDDAIVLSRAERCRLDSFRKPDNRARFLCAAVLLRRLVAVETGIVAAQVAVDRTCAGCGDAHGRPQLVGLDLHTSIAHSGNRVGVALTRAGTVGLDVEQAVPRDFQRLAGRMLRGTEQASGLGEFYRYWTRKESVLKATGAGLTGGLRQVVVSPPHEPARLESYPGVAGLTAAMYDLSPGSGYLAAITVLNTASCQVVEQWWPATGRLASSARRRV